MIDDNIVMSLDVHARNPMHMWMQLAKDYNTVTLAQQSVARKEFLNFTITMEESHVNMKLLIKVTIQGGVIDVAH